VNRSVFGPLARLVSPDEPTLEGLARRAAFPVAGVLVFNPSPFSRSGIVTTADGRVRLVQHIPALGHAFEPGLTAGVAAVRDTLAPAESAAWTVRLDQRTGAVASLTDRSAGTDLVKPGGGFNRLGDSTLTDGWVERYPGIGTRLVARRSTPRADVTSRVTVWDALPWVEFENLADGGVAIGPWHFDLAEPPGELAHEVAGGAVTLTSPVAAFRTIRWTALRNENRTTYFGTGSPDTLSLDAGGSLTAAGAGPATRFRIGIQRGIVLPDDPWRFGFGMLPLVAVTAPGSGSARFPTFGSLLDVPDPAVALVDLREADDGVGLIGYLMDLAGVARDILIRPGVLQFESALLTDLVERDSGPLPPAPGGGLAVPIEPHGYVAFRLLGVRVAG
jgi:hypothetical protein